MNIEVESLEKQFGDHRVLEGVSFSVSSGESIAIIGGSGSGKSTLLNIVAGILSPTAGSVRFDGTDITELTKSQLDERRVNWGFCFQNGALLKSMTIHENVALPIREHTDLAESVVENMVRIKLDMVGLTGSGDRYPSELSGGMVKRAALARALALDPGVLFCDEPSSGLDPVLTAAIDKLILDLTDTADITVLLVTHSMESAFRVGDRIILLHEGDIVAQGTPDELAESSDPFVNQFLEGKVDGPIPLRRNREKFLREIQGGTREP